MSDLRKAAEELMPILDCWKMTYPPCSGADWNKVEALRQALAQPEQEPVAWGLERDGLILDVICPEEHSKESGNYTIPLYTAPPKREWAGLTDEEIEVLCDLSDDPKHGPWYLAYARFVEAKLKEKNT